jgi:uncharacterized membrane protein YdjX (TVP38/TMEM64 family)
MRVRTRFMLLFLALSVLVLLVFLLWGGAFETGFSAAGSARYFRDHPRTAGGLGVGLLVADLLLPIPTTGVIGGLGAALGAVPGFLWGWLGLSLAGLLGYGLARLGGERWADRLASPAEQAQFRVWFDTWGSLAIVISRLLPILPEVLSVLAGLYRMHARRFIPAVILGSVPPALIFAWLGSEAREHPGPALWAMVLILSAAWGLFLWIRRT